MKLNIAFSTCPNDTFIFDALVNNRINTNGLSFNTTLADIEELNNLAIQGEVHMVKISYALYPLVSENYQLLTAGGAMGQGVGPLVISKRKVYADEVKHTRIAIPGEHTTANLLFTLAFPNATDKRTYLFSDIEDAVLSNEVDVGVIIHESRFTYQQKGLKKILDLGDFWERETGLPIPLGGIAVRRDLPQKIKESLNALVQKSVETAFNDPLQTYNYVKKYAQSMDDSVIRQHIELYVNQFSINLGEVGKDAIIELYKRLLKTSSAYSIMLYEPIFAF